MQGDRDIDVTCVDAGVDGGDAVLHVDQPVVPARQRGSDGALFVADLELVVLHGHGPASVLGLVAHGVSCVLGALGRA
ncbi:hypothetical protein ACF1AB_39270 [Streptomyces sp. NPDC014846]|uniref:hypothetical protein n=1 Tax=Streptomyces sp. NPDC014846 TaxID=3364922 RepID=UPI0036FD7FC3